jgi:uncharacterized membrane protein
MSTPASIAKHPIHPMLVVFPIGLWIFSFVSDLIFLLGGSPVWDDIAFYAMVGGLVGALGAAVPGFFDMFSISDPKVGKIARNHMILNLLTVAIFGVNVYLRTILASGSSLLPITLSLIGLVFLAFSGWLGGEMVYVHGVGVEPESKRGAREKAEKSRAVRRAG